MIMMKDRRYSVDKVLRRGMTVTGICLALMIAGKAARMVREDGDPVFQAVDGRQKAAECLMDLWGYYYPAGKAWAQMAGAGDSGRLKEEGGLAGMVAGWIGFFWEQNPVCRFLAMEEERQTQYQDLDPAYESYCKTREFYEEHQYLTYYGDEESRQEEAPEPEALAEEPAVEIPGSGAVHTAQGDRVVTGTQYVMEQLADYDFLMKHFYNVHASTTATREEMNAKKLLEMDLSIQKDQSQPQILIYHSHSQETYADYGSDNPDATVLGIGDYLTELLQAKGYQVIHDKSVYDLKDGQLDRSKAYTYALDGIMGILQEHPSIQVVLDLHRDGVKEGLHLVSQVNGKQTAPIMFFNGMSQTPDGAIEYLQNPYKEENLAFSLQMQLDAAAYYPGLTRKIYLKGLRYNLHVRPRSALIEVGAQTNTYEEARNAMEPLAELLDMVLHQE